jgi:hypothetical protein
MCGISKINLLAIALASSSTNLATPPSQDRDEILVVRAAVVRAREVAAPSQSVCLSLKLAGLPTGDHGALAQRAAHSAQGEDWPAFAGLARVFARHGGQGGTEDRMLEAAALGAEPTLRGARVIDGCPAGLWLTLQRPILSTGAALILASIAGRCMSGMLTIGLSRRGARWRVEAMRTFWVSVSPACSIASPEATAPPGPYLLIER